MKTKPKKILPKGVFLIAVFYTINSVLFLLSTVLFFAYLDIFIFGKIMSTALALSLRLFLIILPLYLAFAFFLLKKEGFFLALIYHLFFMINGLLTIIYLANKNLNIRPLLEIALKPEYKTNQIMNLFGIPFHLYGIQISSVAIGFLIILYLFKKRNCFTA